MDRVARTGSPRACYRKAVNMKLLVVRVSDCQLPSAIEEGHGFEKGAATLAFECYIAQRVQWVGARPIAQFVQGTAEKKCDKGMRRHSSILVILVDQKKRQEFA